MPRVIEYEVREAIDSTKPDKALGPNGVLNRAIRIAVSEIVPYLIRMFNRSLELRYYLMSFRDGLTIMLRKPGKETYRELKSYRLIALLNILSKVIDIVVVRRIAYLIERY